LDDKCKLIKTKHQQLKKYVLGCQISIKTDDQIFYLSNQGGSQEHIALIADVLILIILHLLSSSNTKVHKFLALFCMFLFYDWTFWLVDTLHENFNSWLSFQRQCCLLWGYPK